MTEINIFTIIMAFTGATAAAVKGEVEEYINEELLPGLANGNKLDVSVSCNGTKDANGIDRLCVELRGTTDQDERIAFVSWLAENPLWKQCAITAIASHYNEHFDLIAESYRLKWNNLMTISYIGDRTLDWAVKECMEYESLEAKQAAADMVWHTLDKTHATEHMTVAIRRKHAS